DWTDRPLEELRESELFTAIQATPGRVAFPGGESFPEVHERALGAIESVVRRHDEEDTVAVVSHADVIKLVVAAYLGLHIDLFQRLWVSPASLSALALPQQGTPFLLLFNDTGHLGAGG
ncbi:MAG: histidine phosphatase family protein, partial [Nitriliruptorales bacterium]